MGKNATVDQLWNILRISVVITPPHDSIENLNILIFAQIVTIIPFQPQCPPSVLKKKPTTFPPDSWRMLGLTWNWFCDSSIVIKLNFQIPTRPPDWPSKQMHLKKLCVTHFQLIE